MASGPSIQSAKRILNAEIGGISYTPPPSVDVRMWTAAPTFAGTGGTQVSGGGYSPQVVTVGGPQDGGTGQLAKIASDAAVTFSNMPVASTAVVAISFHDHSTGDLVWLNDSWTPPDTWAVGESPQFPVAALVVDIVPV